MTDRLFKIMVYKLNEMPFPKFSGYYLDMWHRHDYLWSKWYKETEPTKFDKIKKFICGWKWINIHEDT